MAEATHLPLRAGFNRVPTARAGHFILFLTGAGTGAGSVFLSFLFNTTFCEGTTIPPQKGVVFQSFCHSPPFPPFIYCILTSFFVFSQQKAIFPSVK